MGKYSTCAFFSSIADTAAINFANMNFRTQCMSNRIYRGQPLSSVLVETLIYFQLVFLLYLLITVELRSYTQLIFGMETFVFTTSSNITNECI
jgi:hypothetical protein